jgi:sugar phosphate permease
MLAGILMAGGALVGLSFVSGFALFYFFYCFNALGYVCGGPLPNQVLLSGWFDKARGKAMGLAYLGIGVGGALVPFVVTTLRESFGWGWRGALQGLGLLMILVALPAAFLVREPPRSAGPATAGEAPSLRGVLGRPAFYLLALGSMASIGAVGGTIQNLALYLTERRLTERDIDAVQSLVLTGSIVGRLLMGWLADRWPKKYVMLLIYTIVAVSIPLMVFAPTPGQIKLFAVLFGIGLGGDYMIIPLMAAELFGLRVMGRVMGVVLTADSVAESLVPMGVAALRDSAGSWTSGFLVLLGLAATGAVAVALLPKSGATAPRQP